MADPFLECPKHWLKGTLEPNSTLGLIKSVDTGSTPKTSEDDYWDGDIPWLTPKEVTRSVQIYVTETERNITEAGLANSSAKLMSPGTVMLTKRAPVGAVVVNAVPMATNQGFLNFCCGELLRPLYLAFWLRTNKPYLEKVANGSTYPELYKNDLFEFQIAVPTPDVQDKIIGVIMALQYSIMVGAAMEQAAPSPAKSVEIQAHSRRLLSIFQEALPLLMSGKLDLSKLKQSLVENVL
jgi:Type I restriction modification DNA specificity domain